MADKTLERNEFAVLAAVLAARTAPTQRQIAQVCGLSVGTVNSAIATLHDTGLLDAYTVTPAGIEALAPYRVNNAVILAAGLSTRFAPISYEKPKGMLKVRGEVLMERQIEQLHEAGIDDITIVVGYMKEEFFYLADKYGADIVVNPLYAQRNNNYTLWLVRDRLANTFVCSSDNYFVENPFEPYVYDAYYAAEHTDEPTEEYLITVGPHDIITAMDTAGGPGGWCAVGHAYFDRAFSTRFIELLGEVVEKPKTYDLLWEDVYARFVHELPMRIRRYAAGVLNEFDSLDDLRRFDPYFIDNVDSSILDNIESVLGCTRDAIRDITPIKQGLTNMSFKFTCDGKPYVYRHPGAGTDEIISRIAETQAETVAKELGLDGTFLHEDERTGWKLSHFIEGSASLDYHDDAQVKHAMKIARTLHRCGRAIEAAFDVYEKAEEIIALLNERARASFSDFDELHASIERVHGHLVHDGVAPCLCHNDFYDPNFLVTSDAMHLIDWEYAGMGDYASDLGTFICCSDYTYDEALRVISWYFDREPSDVELAHCVGYVALSAFYWYVWAIYKDVCGDPVGEYLYIWYRYAKDYAKRALELRSSCSDEA